jgi:molybdopterin-guanine dinucleotide biosynthesis protein A
VADTTTARGPLAGIHAALRDAAHDSVLVVACDMPRINPALLVGLLDDPQGDVVIPRPGRHFEPLLAVYRRSCLPAIEAVLEEGSARVPAFFSAVEISIWDESRLRALDPDLLSLTNWNRPEDIPPSNTKNQ